MRCTYCNVDLEDKQQICPLCGKPAANEKPHIARVTAPYPSNPDKEADNSDSKNKK